MLIRFGQMNGKTNVSPFFSNVVIDNQTLFDQMLPAVYQQNNASVMRTNYPGYFDVEEPRRKQTIGSDSQSDSHALVQIRDPFRSESLQQRSESF